MFSGSVAYLWVLTVEMCTDETSPEVVNHTVDETSLDFVNCSRF